MAKLQPQLARGTLEKRAAQPSVQLATAVIVDVVKSRALDADSRRGLQATILTTLDRWNHGYMVSLAAFFTMTLGDEFEGLVANPEIIPDMMWELERDTAGVQFRWGLGFGEVHTLIGTDVGSIDGPAFHGARAAINEARKDGKEGGVYAGYMATDTDALNGLARLLAHQRRRFSKEQREAIELLRAGSSQSDAAQQLGVSKQALSQRIRAAGWPAYTEGERALKALLAAYRHEVSSPTITSAKRVRHDQAAPAKQST